MERTPRLFTARTRFTGVLIVGRPFPTRKADNRAPVGRLQMALVPLGAQAVVPKRLRGLSLLCEDDHKTRRDADDRQDDGSCPTMLGTSGEGV
jgi:hypothetical protein